LFLFFGPRFEVENQTHLVGAGGGIRTLPFMAISPLLGFFSPTFHFFLLCFCYFV
jgi:hypothetical protein